MAKTMEGYEKEAEQDLHFDMNVRGIAEYSSQVAKRLSKWSRYRAKEDYILKVAQQDLREIYAQLHHYYLHNHETIIERKDVDLYIKGDRKYMDAEMKVEAIAIRCEFVKAICDALKTQSYHITNITKLLELEAGK